MIRGWEHRLGVIRAASCGPNGRWRSMFAISWRPKDNHFRCGGMLPGQGGRQVSGHYAQLAALWCPLTELYASGPRTRDRDFS